MFKKNFANLITFSRIVGSLILLFINTNLKLFYLVYTYCGLSDVLDGLIARRTKTESEFGSKLDSISDLLFFGILLYKMWFNLVNKLPSLLIYVIFLIILIRVIGYVYYFIKNRSIVSEHTVLNKLSGILLFLVVYVLNTNYYVYYVCATIVVALISSIKDLVKIYDFKY